MKHIFITMTMGLIITCSSIYGQNNYLIYNKEIADVSRKRQAILQKEATNVSVDFVGIDLEKTLDNDEFVLQFSNKSFNIEKKRMEVRGIRNFCFSGKNETDGISLVITVLDDAVLGTLSMPDAIYKIETLDSNEYAVILLDISGLKEDCDDLLVEGEIEDDELYNIPANENSINNDTNNTENIYSIDSEDNETIETFSSLERTSHSDCKIRVLVVKQKKWI